MKAVVSVVRGGWDRGSRKTHSQAWTAEQEALEGRFRTVQEAVRWCAEVFGIEAPYGFRRWGYRKKVIGSEADVEAQEVWKKSFLEALCQEGLRRGEEVVLVDEMRVGLLGESRRVWGKRGEAVR